MKPLYFIGIDPGSHTKEEALSGGAALLNIRGACLDTFSWTGELKDASDKILLWQQQTKWRTVAALERVWGVKGWGVTTMSKLMTNYGEWRGILVSNRLYPFENPAPQLWQDEFRKAYIEVKGEMPEIILNGLRFEKSIKALIWDMARTYYPEVELILQPKSKRGKPKPLTGISDALMIGRWLFNQYIKD